jgi:hypothetical protein
MEKNSPLFARTSWTLLWRDLADLSMVHESKITGWKDSLRGAFTHWRHTSASNMLSRTGEGSDPLEISSYWAGLPLCNLGVILLLADTEMIRIFAGSTREWRYGEGAPRVQ